MYSRTDASSVAAAKDPPKKLFITTGAAEVGLSFNQHLGKSTILVCDLKHYIDHIPPDGNQFPSNPSSQCHRLMT